MASVQPDRRTPSERLADQLADPATCALINLAHQRGRRVQVVLSLDTDGKMATPKVTAS